MSKGALATYPLLGAVTCQNVYFFPIVAISIIFSNLSPELLINFLPKLRLNRTSYVNFFIEVKFISFIIHKQMKKQATMMNSKL